MEYIRIHLFVIFFVILSPNLYSTASDEVTPESEDFETSPIEDEIFDPFEPINFFVWAAETLRFERK